MDWTKAKNILIIALILTNIVLILACSFKQEETKVSNDQAVLISHLKTKNIFVNTQIPEKQNRMPVLSVKFEKIDQDAIEETLKKQKHKLPSNATKKEIFVLTDSFLEICGVMKNSVKHDKIVRYEDRISVLYKNIFQGIPIEESYINCTIENGKIVDIDQYWLTPINNPKQKKQVIPASTALMKFATENKSQEKIYINKIQLVYWVDRNYFKSSAIQDTVSPTWKITYNNGKTEHIPAFK